MDDKVKELVGSISIEDFTRGLLLSYDAETLGDIWDQNMTCRRCIFVKQCKTIGDYFREHGTDHSCSQIIDLLLGDLKVEDIQ